MEVHINGDKRDIEEGVTLERLLASLGIKSAGIAVDINREVIPKRLYGDTLIRQGDSIEIIRMVGGG